MSRRPWRTIAALSTILCGNLIGCSSADTTGIPTASATISYYALQLNAHAIIMSTASPYDTVQLSVTAYDGAGHLIPLPGPVTYTVSDTTITVNSAGLLTAKHKSLNSQGSKVVAQVQDTIERVTHVDTAFVLVTTTTPTAPLATYSIHQLPAGDSAILDVNGGTKELPLIATDAAGQPIPSSALLSHFVSSDPFTATVVAATGVVTGKNPGTVLLSSSISYYGVIKSDTLRLKIGYVDLSILTFSEGTFATGPTTPKVTVTMQYIGQGKSVMFMMSNFSYHPHALDIIFDDSDAVQASPDTLATKYMTGPGNIAPISIPPALYDSVLGTGNAAYWPLLDNYCNTVPSPCYALRMFPTPGTYHWHSTLLGLSGTIIVLPIS